jgi:hypothetical protein
MPTRWSTPPGEGELSADGERYRLTWFPSSSTTKKALFRVATDDGVAVLQHVRTIHVRQRGVTGSEIDTGAVLADIPRPLVAAMRDDGVRPADAPQERDTPAPRTGESRAEGDA